MTQFGLVVLSLTIILIFASQVAGRLDKLHRRVSSARTTLWRRCNERYEVAARYADNEAILMAEQAKNAGLQDMFSTDHLYYESQLTRMLQAGEMQVPIQAAQLRLQDSRRIYNEAVRSTLYLRSWRISRWLKLVGRASAPRYLDFDDSLLNP
jgi:hypothetical protein